MVGYTGDRNMKTDGTKIILISVIIVEAVVIAYLVNSNRMLIDTLETLSARHDELLDDYRNATDTLIEVGKVVEQQQELIAEQQRIIANLLERLKQFTRWTG